MVQQDVANGIACVAGAETRRVAKNTFLEKDNLLYILTPPIVTISDDVRESHD